MAVCKRCGKTFDYNKREGVCPACCFYNRPAGTWHEDESWMKNYNYEDNSYDIVMHDSDDRKYEERLGKFLVEKDSNDVGATLKDALGRSKHKEVDGSHTHLSNGDVVRGSGQRVSGGKKSYSSRKPAKKKSIPVFLIVLIVYWLFLIIGSLLR